MRKQMKFAVLVCSIFGFMQQAQASDTPGGYISFSDQRQAIVDCKYDLGRRGYPKFQVTYTEYPAGGPSVVRLLPSRSMSEQDAAWINACADKKLGRGSGPVDPRPVESFCSRHSEVMVGGSAYCIGW